MPGPASSWFRHSPDGLVLALRVTPNAGRDAIEGVETRADGQAVLRLRVAAVPDKGRANAAVLALLAPALGVPKSCLHLVSGETSRLKTVLVAGDTVALALRAEALAGLG